MNIKIKTQNITAQQVPELRFPEFTDQWSSDKLGSIATFSRGKGISKADIHENGATECIRYGELYTVYTEVISEIVSRTNLHIDNLVISEKNDVIIPASGETQIDIATASCVLKAGIALSGDLNIIKSKTNGVFLSYYLNNAKKHKIARLAQGISVVHLYASQLSSLNVNIPIPPEQQKIATFLTSIDERIQLLEKKKAQLEAYKKGVMQKIFSQEIRFKDDNGNDYPDWEEKKLGEVCEIVGGGTPSTSKQVYWNGNIKWLTPTEIRNKYISDSIRTISKLGLQKSSAKILPIGTLLFTSRATIGAISISTEELATNQGFQSFIPNHNYSTGYLYYWILMNLKLFIRKSTGSTFIEISKREIQKIKIILPSIAEQQKIASFLSSIDESIEQVSNQIEHSKSYKKGLLQKMFV